MPAKSTQTYSLPSGAEIEIETYSDRQAGASDVAPKRGDKIPFEEVIAPLGEVAELLFNTIKSSVNKPNSVTLEFGASLKGQTKLLIVSGEGVASIKVSLTWTNEATGYERPHSL